MVLYQERLARSGVISRKPGLVWELYQEMVLYQEAWQGQELYQETLSNSSLLPVIARKF